MLHRETNPSFPFNPRLPLAALSVAGRRPGLECKRQTFSHSLFEQSRKGFHLQHQNRMGRKYFLACSISSCFETEARDALVRRGVYAWE
ncbi:hypothetical protein CDAR_400741 [Caerostris darwini]|uniref:Ribosomal protein S14 n=1 Tax=Caerostris darwini TaxID=1538125 RepID=A0AAV4NAB0_9ARAC|nr:hypothetical protein CDAR_400741 [Caerostris darwini]